MREAPSRGAFLKKRGPLAPFEMNSVDGFA